MRYNKKSKCDRYNFGPSTHFMMCQPRQLPHQAPPPITKKFATKTILAQGWYKHEYGIRYRELLKVNTSKECAVVGDGDGS